MDGYEDDSSDEGVEIRDLLDAIVEDTVVPVRSVQDVHFFDEQPKYIQEMIQVVGLCDGSLPEGPLAYHVGILCSPFTSNYAQKMHIKIYPSSTPAQGVFIGANDAKPTELTIDTDQLKNSLLIPVSRDMNYLQEQLRSGNDAYQSIPRQVMDVSMQYTGKNTDLMRRELLKTGMVSLDDRINVAFTINGQKIQHLELSFQTLLNIQYQYIQKQTLFFDASVEDRRVFVFGEKEGKNEALEWMYESEDFQLEIEPEPGKFH